jgi:hypothetical protein
MRMLFITAGVAVGLMTQVSGQTPAPAAPKVQLTFEADGNVTLIANGATVREILAEWTRKGGTPFYGAERLPATPLSLRFEHRPDAEVIASLLRNAAGYVLGPKRDAAAGASELEVVFVLATSTPSAVTGYSAPTYTPPPQPQVSTVGSPDAEIPPVGPGRAGAPPQPNAPPPPGPAPRPSGVSGVAVPVVPVVGVPPTTTTGRGGRGGGGGGGR